MFNKIEKILNITSVLVNPINLMEATLEASNFLYTLTINKINKLTNIDFIKSIMNK